LARGVDQLEGRVASDQAHDLAATKATDIEMATRLLMVVSC